MDGSLAFRAFILGFVIAAPVGPIGMLCIQRGLQRGFSAALAGGVGTALADAVYAGLAAAGLAALVSTYDGALPWLRYGGAAFMVFLGMGALFRAPDLEAMEDGRPTGRLQDFGITFGLTLANPATILSFAVLFGGLGLEPDMRPADAVQLVAGVFLGSLAWWISLSAAVALARRWVTAGLLHQINRTAGLALILMAVWIAVLGG